MMLTHVVAYYFLILVCLIESKRLSTFRTDSLGIQHYKHRKDDHSTRSKKSSVDLNSSSFVDSNIGEEIFHYLKNYFFKSRSIPSKEWQHIHDDLLAVGDIKRLELKHFFDNQPTKSCEIELGQQKSTYISTPLLDNIIFRSCQVPIKVMNWCAKIETEVKVSRRDEMITQRIAEILSRLNDPYTMYLSAKSMKKKSVSIHGDRTSCGLMIRRRLRWTNPVNFIKLSRTQVTSNSSDVVALRHHHRNIFHKVLNVFRLKKDHVDKHPHKISLEDMKKHSIATITSSFQFRSLSLISSMIATIATASIDVYFSSYPIKSYPNIISKHLSIETLRMICPQLRYIAIALTFISAFRFFYQHLNSLEVSSVMMENLSAQVGDRILTIDGRYVDNKYCYSIERCLDEGNDGDIVHVGILRNNEFMLIPIQRNNIIDIRVDYNILPSDKNKLAYIRLKDFSDYTYYEVSDALHDMNQHISSTNSTPIEGLILDLRGNLGGQLGTSLDVASLFLPKGSTLTQLLSADRIEKHYSTNHDMSLWNRDRFHVWCRQVKIMILVDHATASASETLTAALQINNRAVVVGSCTTAKNKAQAVISLRDGSGLIFTVRELLDPTGRSMGGGILPDLYIGEPNDLKLLLSIMLNTSSGNWHVGHHRIYSQRA